MGNDLLPGTLDMLILRSLTRGARHGYGIALHLKKISEDVLDVGESSLYPPSSASSSTAGFPPNGAHQKIIAAPATTSSPRWP